MQRTQGLCPGSKGEGFVRKATKGGIFANDLGKLNLTGEVPDSSRKVRELGVRVLPEMIFVLPCLF